MLSAPDFITVGLTNYEKLSKTAEFLTAEELGELEEALEDNVILSEYQNETLYLNMVHLTSWYSRWTTPSTT